MKRPVLFSFAAILWAVAFNPCAAQDKIHGRTADRVAGGLVWHNNTGYNPYADANQTITIPEAAPTLWNFRDNSIKLK